MEDLEITPKPNQPADRKIMEKRWVLALKNNVGHRARCLAKVFRQIPGKDIQGNHTAVIKDTT
jgi:hypothetical protein